MQTIIAKPDAHSLGDLLRGQPQFLRAWSERWDAGRFIFCTGVILAGAGLYGAAMGSWRDPWQALFVAIKFPLILLLTTLGNALLNGMVAPLLGVNLGLRQSCLAIVLSFTIAAAILAAFSPVVAFLVWNAPPMTSDFRASGGTYSLIMLTHVVLIAFAGVTANLRLAQLLRQFSKTPAGARRVLLAWLAGNLFLGSQLCWILRPFIGAPNLAVQFLRPNAFQGNFYETVFRSALRLFDFH
jgi:hypothetical protein